MKSAIVALTRGYPSNKDLYSDLIKRNLSIYEKIIKLASDEIDLVLFHEGNISSEDQKYISSNYPSKIIFKDVSKYFRIIDIDLEGENKFNLGYRQMCRFNMFYIWDEVSNYDYIFRVDEDVEILDCDPNLFSYMKKKGLKYMTGRFTKETHRLTNETLPYYLLSNSNLNVKKIYNHRNPYTNLYASSVKFWLNNDVQEILKLISLTDDQIRYRWGDHTVQGLILNHKKVKINLFPKLEYKHLSHELIIKNNFIRNIFINSKINPIYTNDGILGRIKSRLRGKFKSTNQFDFENH